MAFNIPPSRNNVLRFNRRRSVLRCGAALSHLPDGLSAPSDRLDRHRERTVGRYHSDRSAPARTVRSAPPTARLSAHVSRARFETPTTAAPHEDASRSWLVEVVLMERDNQITLYVSDETKAELEQRAEEEDMSVSPYIDTIIRRYFVMEAEDQIATEVRAEERLEELIALGKDELRDVARDIADMNAKMGAYAAANFELMKTDHPDAMRRDALSTGSRRIRQDVDVVHDELDAAAQTDDSPPQSTASDGGGSPSGDDDTDDGGRKGPFERIRDSENEGESG